MDEANPCSEVIVKAVPMVADYIIPLLGGMDAAMKVSLRYIADMRLSALEPGAPIIHIRGGTRPVSLGAEVRALGSLRFGLFASQLYLSQRAMPKGPQDMAGHSFIAHDRDRNVPPWEAWLTKTSPDAHYFLRSDCEIAHRFAVSSGHCMGFLPASALLNYPDLVEIETIGPGWEVMMWLVVDEQALQQDCLTLAADLLTRRLRQVWA